MKIKLLWVFLGVLSILMVGACVPYSPVVPPPHTPWTPTQPFFTPTTTIPTPTATPTTTPTGIAKWTFMVYIDGDNNLEPAAVGDLNEMEMVGSTSSVNIVAEIDRIPGYDTSNGDWTGTRRYYVKKDYDPYVINSQLIQDLGELNMGNPQTLVDFVSWAVSNYPAEHYALVIWNHGGGFRKVTGYPISKDIAIDDTNSDKITMGELSLALSRINSILGKKLDLLGMDACLMGMIEVAYEIKDYANVMVASEESEPLEGWPYDRLLADLVSNPSMSAGTLGSHIVNDFVTYYQGTDTVTLSAIDLTQIGTVASFVSQFALSVINDTVTPGSQYISSANSAQYYQGDTDFIDLYDFANQVLNNPFISNPTGKTAAGNIMSAVSSAIIAEGDTLIGEDHGLSIYFPYTPPMDARYPLTKFARDTYWDEMLQYLGY